MWFFAVSFTSWTGWRKTQNCFRSRLTAKNAENRILCGSVFCQQTQTLESNEKTKQHKTCLRLYENGAMGKHCQDRSSGRRQSKSLSLGKLGVHFSLTFFWRFSKLDPKQVCNGKLTKFAIFSKSHIVHAEVNSGSSQINNIVQNYLFRQLLH